MGRTTWRTGTDRVVEVWLETLPLGTTLSQTPTTISTKDESGQTAGESKKQRVDDGREAR